MCDKLQVFLGNIENESQQIGAEKTEADNTFINDEKTEVDKTKNATVICCSLCHVKMSQTKTKFRIKRWAGSHKKLPDDDSGKLGDDLLPVIVYMCPKCGKIEFMADEKLNKTKYFTISSCLKTISILKSTK